MCVTQWMCVFALCRKQVFDSCVEVCALVWCVWRNISLSASAIVWYSVSHNKCVFAVVYGVAHNTSVFTLVAKKKKKSLLVSKCVRSHNVCHTIIVWRTTYVCVHSLHGYVVCSWVSTHICIIKKFQKWSQTHCSMGCLRLAGSLKL